MFWEGFYKRANIVTATKGMFSRGRRTPIPLPGAQAHMGKKANVVPPPIPGPKVQIGNPAHLPGQGAMVMGERGLKQAPQSIKGKGVGSMAIP